MAVKCPFPSFSPYTGFLHCLYHTLFIPFCISFCFLTSHLCMLICISHPNIQHLFFILVWHLCLCLTLKHNSFHFFLFLAFQVPCNDKHLPQQQGSFLLLCFISPWLLAVLTTCGSLWGTYEMKFDWTLLSVCMCQYTYRQI
jgi:hypothetical protein